MTTGKHAGHRNSYFSKEPETVQQNINQDNKQTIHRLDIVYKQFIFSAGRVFPGPVLDETFPLVHWLCLFLEVFSLVCSVDWF